jgi:hypothetical protein
VTCFVDHLCGDGWELGQEALARLQDGMLSNLYPYTVNRHRVLIANTVPSAHLTCTPLLLELWRHKPRLHTSPPAPFYYLPVL